MILAFKCSWTIPNVKNKVSIQTLLSKCFEERCISFLGFWVILHSCPRGQRAPSASQHHQYLLHNVFISFKSLMWLCSVYKTFYVSLELLGGRNFIDSPPSCFLLWHYNCFFNILQPLCRNFFVLPLCHIFLVMCLDEPVCIYPSRWSWICQSVLNFALFLRSLFALPANCKFINHARFPTWVDTSGCLFGLFLETWTYPNGTLFNGFVGQSVNCLADLPHPSIGSKLFGGWWNKDLFWRKSFRFSSTISFDFLSSSSFLK